MKTHIYFVRHAQSDFSVRDDRTRPLTEKGLADTYLVTDVLKDKSIFAVYSSPYKRCLNTIKGLADSLDLKINIIEDFRERRIGDTWIEDFKGFIDIQWADFDYKLANGECLREVQERNIAALFEVLKQNQGKSIAIGTHGTALSTIVNYFIPKYGVGDFWGMAYKNPYILCFSFSGAEFINMEEIEF